MSELQSLWEKKLIEEDMICPEGGSDWATYSSWFRNTDSQKKTEVKASSNTAIPGHLKELRAASRYGLARNMILWTAAFAIVGLVALWVDSLARLDVAAIVVTGGILLLKMGGVIGLAQFAQAMLDMADAVVETARQQNSR
jgi:hypothetical protein